jgi:hypothetical protein
MRWAWRGERSIMKRAAIVFVIITLFICANSFDFRCNMDEDVFKERMAQKSNAGSFEKEIARSPQNTTAMHAPAFSLKDHIAIASSFRDKEVTHWVRCHEKI